MKEIKVLDKATIDKIAAGEVVERPASVVKELMENSIDSGASAMSVEIREGGTTFIRVTDNGSGIEKKQIKTAFLRHATSKINSAVDLSNINTLGFRGEALSSIAAVSEIELCTKTDSSMTGTIYKISGGEEISIAEAGLPNGTTVIVKNLFFNTPARLKFLKTVKTEAIYVSDVVEKIALSHPEVSIKFVINGSQKLNTPGNGELKDTIYAIYGRQIVSKMIKINTGSPVLSIHGYIGRADLCRGNRNYETYFVNGRYVKDKIISSAMEDAYKGYMMKGSFPFTFINIIIEPELVDVNVHPAKSEVRFYDNEQVYNTITDLIRSALQSVENIPDYDFFSSDGPIEIPSTKQNNNTVQQKAKKVALFEMIPPKMPEPFETSRLKIEQQKKDLAYKAALEREKTVNPTDSREENNTQVKYEQTSLFDDDVFLSKEARAHHRIVGEIFNTYWIVEFSDSFYIIDQHAAHEKVLYEKFINKVKKNDHYSQNIMPSIIVSLSDKEADALEKYNQYFYDLGFEIEHFGGNEYSIGAVPADLMSLNSTDLFLSLIDEISDIKGKPEYEMIIEKIAGAACKAAVKGGNKLSVIEADALIDSLLQLDNPYNCPHGRPTIIRMTKNELEKKFRRIL